MATLVFIITIFFTSYLGEPMIPLPDEYIDSSSFAPINRIVKNDGGGNTTYRRDVCLNCPQLIVTYRKR